MSPQAKRQGVRYLVEERNYSERRACQVVGISRSSARYQRNARADEAKLRKKVRETAEQHPTYGCPRITVLIRREGSTINHKRIHRLWKEEGLQLPRRRPKKRYYHPVSSLLSMAFWGPCQALTRFNYRLILSHSNWTSYWGYVITLV